MTIPFFCVFLAFALTYALKIPVVIWIKKSGLVYDNNNGRDQQTKLAGWGRRALAAHQNSFEGFPIFAAAVIIAHLKNADPTWSGYLAMAYIVSRLFYAAFYLGNLASLRTTVWILGMAAVAALFFI